MANLSWISSNPDYINQMIRNTQVTLSNNYNDLDNIPIIKITSTTNNPQKIWELKEGLYIINGVAQVDNNTSYEVSNLLISMTARLENGKYILSAFIPYLRGLFEYILKTNSTEYEQHQKIVLMIKDDTLTLDNETIYTPIENYHPATKKYVDDKANEIVAELDRMGVNKENLESLNKENRIRDIKLQALLSETSDRNITIEENVRYFDMPLSIDNGIVTINEIVGETLVNVCDQEESVAITKSYTVENENHIALQGEYDGSCRPVVYGNTLVNHNADWDDSLQTGVETSARGIEDVQVEGIKGQEVSIVVEGNTVLNHALGKTSAVVSAIESENEGNYVDLTVANDMSSVVEIEGRTMYYNNDTGEYLYEFVENSNLSLKSSYECEVTEDGKYKVDVKVTGKNLWNGVQFNKEIYSDTGAEIDKNTFRVTDFISVSSNRSYSYDAYLEDGTRVTTSTRWYDKDKKYIGYGDYAVPIGASYVRLRASNLSGLEDKVVFMISEINSSDSNKNVPYEPYFESTKTFYLNSPLLEGDKIVTKNGKVYHYHKMGRVVLDGSVHKVTASGTDRYMTKVFNTSQSLHKSLISNFRVDDTMMLGDGSTGVRQIDNRFYLWIPNYTEESINKWLQINPITLVYELTSPYYELIDEYSNTILNIPNTVAHLTHTSAVPVNNTVFTNYKDELNVLEPNTQYRVMFDCDTANVPFTVTLGGTSQEVTSKKGTHSLLITTPSELVDKNLVIDGIGRCGIDNIRIFKGDVEYDYVKGLWSGYEERKLENLLNDDMYTIYGDLSPSVEVNNDNEIKATSNSNCIMVFGRKLINIKPYRIYTVICDVQTTLDIAIGFGTIRNVITSEGFRTFYNMDTNYNHIVCKLKCKNDNVDKISIGQHSYISDGEVLNIKNLLVLEGDWTDNPPTYEEVMANEGKYAVKVKLDTNATIFGKGGRL